MRHRKLNLFSKIARLISTEPGLTLVIWIWSLGLTYSAPCLPALLGSLDQLLEAEGAVSAVSRGVCEHVCPV